MILSDHVLTRSPQPAPSRHTAFPDLLPQSAEQCGKNREAAGQLTAKLTIPGYRPGAGTNALDNPAGRAIGVAVALISVTQNYDFPAGATSADRHVGCVIRERFYR